jgi:hypothetical protein
MKLLESRPKNNDFGHLTTVKKPPITPGFPRSEIDKLHEALAKASITVSATLYARYLVIGG